MSKITGSCLCEAVTIEIDGDPLFAAHCQCVDCRKSCGSGHATLFAVPVSAFTVTGTVKAFGKTTDSGGVVTRHFCPECGSQTHNTNTANPDNIMVYANILDNPDIIEPQVIVYTKRALKWDVMDTSLTSFAGMPER